MNFDPYRFSMPNFWLREKCLKKFFRMESLIQAKMNGSGLLANPYIPGIFHSLVLGTCVVITGKIGNVLGRTTEVNIELDDEE
jgi:hypothetical protein